MSEKDSDRPLVQESSTDETKRQRDNAYLKDLIQKHKQYLDVDQNLKYYKSETKSTISETMHSRTKRDYVSLEVEKTKEKIDDLAKIKKSKGDLIK
ncbi:hypothetical protein KGF54_005513 [Candida jiufengensis]|uniref:uncharacterized protein n=1 Tax=Candida jiufengensis TaxID=497108 RepID=UPI00222403A4|nr:uncharacterized protein KGF54_005513 [Candida jiufengensis]KAI5949278.1 hypothetical protein KGF54_005513 [Candida jiufengensis]